MFDLVYVEVSRDKYSRIWKYFIEFLDFFWKNNLFLWRPSLQQFEDFWIIGEAKKIMLGWICFLHTIVDKIICHHLIGLFWLHSKILFGFYPENNLIYFIIRLFILYFAKIKFIYNIWFSIIYSRHIYLIIL